MLVIRLDGRWPIISARAARTESAFTDSRRLHSYTATREVYYGYRGILREMQGEEDHEGSR